ncbi:MAG: hypothetical protein DRK00_07225 [Thermoprotei archaeon]|nr:MAG: hypothetical protein DRK00_07225 [Thermoprotei archaeon]
MTKIYVFEKLGAFKDLRGFNGGPLSPGGWDKLPSLSLADRYLQLGVKVVRIHDYWSADDLDVVFPDGLADPEAPSSYNFRPLDQHVRAVLRVADTIIMRMGFD